jgi:hypothetical protein
MSKAAPYCNFRAPLQMWHSLLQTMHIHLEFSLQHSSSISSPCAFLRERSLQAVGAKYEISNTFSVCPCQTNRTAAEVKAFGRFLRRMPWKLLTCLRGHAFLEFGLSPFRRKQWSANGHASHIAPHSRCPPWKVTVMAIWSKINSGVSCLGKK